MKLVSSEAQGEGMVESQIAERIALALENIVEKLSSIESKIEELTYEVQAQGNMLSENLAPTIECDN